MMTFSWYEISKGFAGLICMQAVRLMNGDMTRGSPDQFTPLQLHTCSWIGCLVHGTFYRLEVVIFHRNFRMVIDNYSRTTAEFKVLHSLDVGSQYLATGVLQSDGIIQRRE